MHSLIVAALLVVPTAAQSAPADRPCEALNKPGFDSAPPPATRYARAACDERVEESLRRADGPRDPERELAAYAKACDEGCADACESAGDLLRIGLAKLRDAAKSFAFLQRACAAKSAGGCSSLGLSHRIGYGTPQDYDKAKQAFARACELGSGHGCASVGSLLYHQSATPDARKARPHFVKGCAMRNGAGCASLAELYEKGHGVTRDVRHAFSLFTCGCRFGHGGSCADAGRLVEGWTPRNDEEREMFAKAMTQAYSEAARLNKDACDRGEPYGCSMLGNAYRDGKGVPKDVERARKLYRYGCDNRMTAGCDGLKSLGQR